MVDDVSPSLRFPAHLYFRDECQTITWVFPISYRYHMRLEMAPRHGDQENLLRAPTSASASKGWEAPLTGDNENATSSAKSITRRPICQELHIRAPTGAQGAMVGKLSIRNSKQLSEFEIQDPSPRRQQN